MGLSFSMGRTSYCFLAAHLAAHQGEKGQLQARSAPPLSTSASPPPSALCTDTSPPRFLFNDISPPPACPLPSSHNCSSTLLARCSHTLLPSHVHSSYPNLPALSLTTCGMQAGVPSRHPSSLVPAHYIANLCSSPPFAPLTTPTVITPHRPHMRNPSSNHPPVLTPRSPHLPPPIRAHPLSPTIPSPSPLPPSCAPFLPPPSQERNRDTVRILREMHLLGSEKDTSVSFDYLFLCGDLNYRHATDATKFIFSLLNVPAATSPHMAHYSATQTTARPVLLSIVIHLTVTAAHHGTGWCCEFIVHCPLRRLGAAELPDKATSRDEGSRYR